MAGKSGRVTAEEQARRAGVSVRTIYRWRAQKHADDDDAMASPDTSSNVILDTLTRQLEVKDQQISDLNERLHELAVTLNRLAIPATTATDPTDDVHPTRRAGGLASWLIVLLVALLAAAAWWWALTTPTP
jgi:hypothetical protein